MAVNYVATFNEAEYTKMVHFTVGPRVARAAAYVVRNRARENLTSHNQTKMLSNSLRVQRLPDLPSGVLYEIYSDAPYAAAVEGGAAPHIIEGNPKLAFYWAKMSQNVVFTFVNHPGNAPTFFLKRALDSLTAADFGFSL